MVNQVTLPLYLGSITQNSRIKFNNSRIIPFRGNSDNDSFQYTSVGKYTTEQYLNSAVKSNSAIKQIIGDVNPNLKLNIEDLKHLQNNHATDIKEISNAIISNLPQSLQLKVNKEAIFDAAILHDLGKVLIPTEILNKPDKLTSEEKEIMHRHSILGYELLKDTGIDSYTLNLVKYHHQNATGTGYPAIEGNFEPDINLQILSLADKYSALTEKRPYKEQFSPKQALTIIYQENIKTGQIHPFVFNALIKSVSYKPEKSVV